DELLVADHGDLLAVRLAVQAERQGLEVHLQVARDLTVGGEATLTSDREEGLLLAALTHLHDVVRADTEGGLVDLLAVDLDVAVGDHLAGLVDRAGDARTQDQRVETALELDDEGLARLHRGLRGTLVGTDELALGEVVLRAQTLLLQQTDLVVRVLLAATAVLTRRVGAGLEVLDGLRGQRDAEGRRLLDLGAGLVRHFFSFSFSAASGLREVASAAWEIPAGPLGTCQAAASLVWAHTCSTRTAHRPLPGLTGGGGLPATPTTVRDAPGSKIRLVVPPEAPAGAGHGTQRCRRVYRVVRAASDRGVSWSTPPRPRSAPRRRAGWARSTRGPSGRPARTAARRCPRAGRAGRCSPFRARVSSRPCSGCP